jgi:hypothetical protein
MISREHRRMMLLDQSAIERQTCFHRARQVSAFALLLAGNVGGLGSGK